MATKLSKLIEEIPALRQMMAPLKRIQELHYAYSDAVPQYLSRASRVGYLDDTTLVLIASNGTTASNLRQRLPSLLSCVQVHMPEITGIRIEVQVGIFYTSATKIRIAERQLSQSGAETLERLANSLDESPLQLAVKRLAGRARKADAKD